MQTSSKVTSMTFREVCGSWNSTLTSANSSELQTNRNQSIVATHSIENNYLMLIARSASVTIIQKLFWNEHINLTCHKAIGAQSFRGTWMTARRMLKHGAASPWSPPQSGTLILRTTFISSKLSNDEQPVLLPSSTTGAWALHPCWNRLSGPAWNNDDAIQERWRYTECITTSLTSQLYCIFTQTWGTREVTNLTIWRQSSIYTLQGHGVNFFYKTFTWHGLFLKLLFGTDFFLWYSCFPGWELKLLPIHITR